MFHGHTCRCNLRTHCARTPLLHHNSPGTRQTAACHTLGSQARCVAMAVMHGLQSFSMPGALQTYIYFDAARMITSQPSYALNTSCWAQVPLGIFAQHIAYWDSLTTTMYTSGRSIYFWNPDQTCCSLRPSRSAVAGTGYHSNGLKPHRYCIHGRRSYRYRNQHLRMTVEVDFLVWELALCILCQRIRGKPVRVVSTGVRPSRTQRA